MADDSLTSHEATKRVLYHVVNCYQGWRNERLGVPNEFTDDAIRIGEKHLRLVDWFPEDAGWLREDEHVPLTYEFGHLRPSGDTLSRIDAELKRLREPISDEGETYLLPWRRKTWRDGVRAAREVAAGQLQQIRDVYVTEQLTRETDNDRTYGTATASVTTSTTGCSTEDIEHPEVTGDKDGFGITLKWKCCGRACWATGTGITYRVYPEAATAYHNNLDLLERGVDSA